MQRTDTATDRLVSLGKYEIRRTLGRGAMGTVYEGWDPHISRRVAIKTVRLPDADDEEAQEELARFRREAQAAGRLTHPNLVGVYDYGESADMAYIVMEFVDGKTLKSLLDAEERLALPMVRRVMDDLLAGLEYSHGQGVIHRDIKPANLMLTSAGQAKVADFGIARIESSSMTQAGTVLGTPAYMSPEQFMGVTVDLRTDVYSSGVLLYQLLTGDKPFEGSLTTIMHKVLNTVPPRPSELSVTAPAALDEVVATAMARRPEDRYPSAAAFARAIGAALDAPVQGMAPDAAAEGGAGDATVIAVPRPVPPRMASGSPGTADASPTGLPRPPEPAPAPAATAAGKARRGVPIVPVAAGAAALLALAGGTAWWLGRDVPSSSPSLRPTEVHARTGVQPGGENTQEPIQGPRPGTPGNGPQVAEATSPTPPRPPEPPSDKDIHPQPDPSAAPADRPTPQQTDGPSQGNPANDPRIVSNGRPTESGPNVAPPDAPTGPRPVPLGPLDSTPSRPHDQATPTTPTAPPEGRDAAGRILTSSLVPPIQVPPALPPSPPVEELRRRAEATVRNTACTAATAEVARDGRLTLRGIAGQGTPEARLRAQGEAVGAPGLDWQVAAVEGPYCDVLDFVRQNARTPAEAGPSLTLSGGRTALRMHDHIEPTVVAGSFPALLQVDYFSRDDKGAYVVHMHSAALGHRLAPAKSRLVLGEERPGVNPLPPRWEVLPPFGTDLIVVTASSHPLVQAEQPTDVPEPAGPYLARLQQSIAQVRQRPGGNVAAAIFVLRTQER